MKLIQLLEVHNQANILAKPTILKYQEVVKLGSYQKQVGKNPLILAKSNLPLSK